MPQPATSSQPVCLHTRQPRPSHSTQEISTSAEGSVKGKYEGRSRIDKRALEQRLHKLMQHRLEIREAHIGIDQQALPPDETSAND